MSVVRFSCHYFTCDPDKIIASLKAAEKNVEKKHIEAMKINASVKKLTSRLTSGLEEAKAALDHLGSPNIEEAVTEKFLSGALPKTVVIIYPGLVSAFPYAPQDDPYNYSGWLKFNTSKNCHPQKHGGIMAAEEDDGSRLIEFWKNGALIRGIEFDRSGNTAEGNIEDLLNSIAGNVCFADGKGFEAKAAPGENTYRRLEEALGFPLLYAPQNAPPPDCSFVEETRLMTIFRKEVKK